MLHFVTLAVCAAVPLNARAPAIIALGEHPDLQRRLDIIRRVKPFGDPLEPLEVLGKLSGIDAPEAHSPASLDAIADRANELEADYALEDASRLRQEIIMAYERAPVVDARLQGQAAQAMHSNAGVLVIANKKKEALSVFVEAQRRFPNVPIDLMRHRPDIVQLYERAAPQVRRLPTTKLLISTTRPGTIYLDGRSFGAIQKLTTLDVPHGRALVWISDARGRSLAHPVEVGDATVEVAIDFDLEARLKPQSTLTLACIDDCDALLQRLRRASRLPLVVGLRMTGAESSEAIIADESEMTRHDALTAIDTLADPPLEASAPKPAVSPWSFAPLGIGQFQQHRPVVGSVFAAATVGALTWHIAAALGRNEGSIDDSPASQNISAAVLAAVVLLSIGESALHDYRDHAYPVKAAQQDAQR